MFQACDIMLPNVKEMQKWSVVACDQFTSQPEYWAEVKNIIQNAPSAFNLILPEVYLSADNTEYVKNINAQMVKYIHDGLFTTYRNAFVYVERTLQNGAIRKGLVGAIDLDTYDYNLATDPLIRATEKTVIERIPPRQAIRRDAAMELSHVLLLCDDHKKVINEGVDNVKASAKLVYDFDLMMNGGHISGWLIEGENAEKVNKALQAYVDYKSVEQQGKKDPFYYIVGDGNHSLASAKAHYENVKKLYPDSYKTHPARYAMVELENLNDDSIEFEPIHRVVKSNNATALIDAFKSAVGKKQGTPVEVVYNGNTETVYLDVKNGELAVGILQEFLDAYIKEYGDEIDYIHGEDVIEKLCKNAQNVGFILPKIEKGQFFDGIATYGVLPRKTFSMGHAQEKRYYLESRVIRK